MAYMAYPTSRAAAMHPVGQPTSKLAQMRVSCQLHLPLATGPRYFSGGAIFFQSGQEALGRARASRSST